MGEHIVCQVCGAKSGSEKISEIGLFFGQYLGLKRVQALVLHLQTLQQALSGWYVRWTEGDGELEELQIFCPKCRKNLNL